MVKQFTDIDRARIELLRKQPFFANLIIHLPMKYVKDMPYVACTDGDTIQYSDKFLEFEPLVMEGVICHEALHCCLLHLWRRGERDKSGWNVACDYSINTIIKDSGLELPSGCLLNYDYRGFSADKIYSLLPKSDKSDSNGNKGGGGTGEGGVGEGEVGGDWFCGGTGLAKDKKDSSETGMSGMESKWKYRLTKAITAARRGNLPGGLEELVDELLYPEVPIELLFKRLITSVSGRGNYRLSPPNKRHLWRGLILPSTISDYVEFNACIDVSGSISRDEISLFLGTIEKVAHEHMDFNVHIFIGDTEVNQESDFTPFTQMTKAVMGRGGTNFIPFFKRINDRHLTRYPTIFLTDLDGNCPENYTGETFWLVPKDRYSECIASEIKFGEIIKIGRIGGK